MKGGIKPSKPSVEWVKTGERHIQGQTGPTGIGGVLHDNKERMWLTFSESTWIMESNEAELRLIRRATHLWASLGYGNLIIENDSANAIAWASGGKYPP